jgi:ABC-2 type transport system ATP-binding protein
LQANPPAAPAAAIDSGCAAAVELRGVTRRHGEILALDGLDLELGPGGCTALLGPNGAGKTTAVRLMLGLLQPDAGEVRIFGRDPRHPRARSRAGAMLQSARVPETLTVGEHLHLFSSYYPRSLPLQRLLRCAGVEGLEDRPFGQLSGGQQRRVLFAIALCGDPDLLVLDEPTAGLDVEARRRMWSELHALVAEGRTLLLTTHHLEEADALAGRIVVLHRGRVLADGTPGQIKGQVAGRRLRFQSTLELSALRELPHARLVHRHADGAEIYTDRPEPLLRALLERDPGLSGLEVAGAGLEEAFLALTEAGRDQRRLLAGTSEPGRPGGP